ncbi:MAG: glycosyltransferase family 4 protein, partial [Terriglobia bacterium]
MDERPAVGILAGEFALAHDAVRKSSRALRDRIYRRLAREFAPAAVRDIVRGATVASDTLIEALITSSGERQYELFAPPKLVDHFAARMRERFNHRPGKAAYVIRSTAELADGSCRLTPAAWLTPSGDWVSSLRIRRDFASRLYPVTAVAHGFGLHHMLHTAFLRLLLVGALECDSIVSGTRASRQALLNVLGHVADGFNAEFGTRLSYRGRTDVVPLCVDTERLRPREKMPLRSILGLPRDAFVVMYVGRLSPSKGDWFPFVKMFSSLVARNPGRKLLLVMCGTQAGAYANRLRDYGRSLGILANLRFKLDFPDSAKEQLIPAADAFVSVSDTVNETFGLAPVEAMACGIPQVVSDWDGYRETVVHNETGFLVPTYWTRCSGDLATTGPLLGTDYENLCIGHSIATDMGDFAGFLQVLMDNAELRARMGQRSRARAIELY